MGAGVGDKISLLGAELSSTQKDCPLWHLSLGLASLDTAVCKPPGDLRHQVEKDP